MTIFQLILSFIIPLFFSLIFIPIIINIAHKKELFDATDHRKTHLGNIPRLGGIGFISAYIVSIIILNIILKDSLSYYFYLSILVIFISGVIDDINPVRAIVKLIAQILASILLIMGGHTLSHIFIPFIEYNLYLGYFQYPITFFWIIGVTNSLNLLDGMDGQAGGVSLIGSLTIGIVSLILGQPLIAVTSFLISGALIGFLKFNLPPAKIFMGDGGSLTIGFILSSFPLLFTQPEHKGKVILVSVAVLLIPMLDVFAAIIRRTKLRISFFKPDRGHIHHKFQDFTNLNTKQTLIVIYSICILSGIFSTIFIFNTNKLTQIGLFINLIIHSFLFAFLHRRKEAGILIK